MVKIIFGTKQLIFCYHHHHQKKKYIYIYKNKEKQMKITMLNMLLSSLQNTTFIDTIQKLPYMFYNVYKKWK